MGLVEVLSLPAGAQSIDVVVDGKHKRVSGTLAWSPTQGPLADGAAMYEVSCTMLEAMITRMIFVAPAVARRNVVTNPRAAIPELKEVLEHLAGSR
jgi:hypothetical protein